MSTQKIADRMLAKVVRYYGWYAGIKYCRNLGIRFEDTYFMVFGKLPHR